MTTYIKELEELSNRDSYIKESEILYILPFEMYEKWENFMRGKTCPLFDNGGIVTGKQIGRAHV